VGWDANGNRVTNGADVFTYDERNQLVISPAGVYTWGPRGTLASITGVDGVAVDFDGLGRMTAVTPDGQATVGYTYDSLDRIAARDGTGFTHNGAELDHVGDGTATYGLTPGGRLTSINQAGSTTLAVLDRHGDLTSRLNTDDTTAASSLYDPFGDPGCCSGR